MKYSLKYHIGKKYTHLTILNEAIQTESWKKNVMVECDCGRTEIKNLYLILHGAVRTCGKCDLRHKLPPLIGKTELTDDIEFRLVRRVYNLRKNKSKNRRGRKIPWNLSVEQFRKLILKPCESCGDSGSCSHTHIYKSELHTLFFNTLDRIDNSKGYVMDNVTVLCQICNKMKLDQSITDMIRRAHGLAKLGKKMLLEDTMI